MSARQKTATSTEPSGRGSEDMSATVTSGAEGPEGLDRSKEWRVRFRDFREGWRR
jgi:hypothetical protein